MAANKSWIPTNKWIVTQVTALTALVTAWVNLGHWDKALTTAAIGLAAQAAISWLTPNANAPGGVQPRAERAEASPLPGDPQPHPATA
jgi:hypothetical protein